jgi:hypothetical protein
MKKIELTHAEVIPHYGTNDAIKEIVVKDKGTIISFNVKTRINDRVANSPVIFEKCSYFANSDEQITRLKEVIQLGNILDIKGSQNRTAYKDKKTGLNKYSDSLNVREITPVQAGNANNPPVEEDLPF